MYCTMYLVKYILCTPPVHQLHPMYPAKYTVRRVHTMTRRVRTMYLACSHIVQPPPRCNRRGASTRTTQRPVRGGGRRERVCRPLPPGMESTLRGAAHTLGHAFTTVRVRTPYAVAGVFAHQYALPGVFARRYAVAGVFAHVCSTLINSNRNPKP